MTTLDRGEHHITIPRHPSLRVGTLAAVLASVAEHFQLPKDDVALRLFGPA